ncbi:hemolysin III family protein [Leptobacterium flavescens]|uniref:Hemolysin III family protein n=1 Tax=Leptobacterium flavescens TaxID=472055 RepID=A0A6P0UR16_9FLAO|nr:hemolysin III family protein [Leptobacterium flavescens]NER14199.1 hemolysin III family protein [Leptobacterium flavescens]
MSTLQSRTEEIWNTASHGVGALLSVAALVILLAFDSGKTAFSTMSILFYGISLIVLYTSSSIYHAVKSVKRKNIWRKLDHIGIYLLIAGTYTPVTLISLESGSGWLIFSVIWALALSGIVLKVFFTGKYEVLSLLMYLFMGWLIVFDMNGLIENTTSSGLKLLMLGGAFYTVGIVFYALRKIPYNHVIWHFFVLGGSISHFLFILTDVI